MGGSNEERKYLPETRELLKGRSEDSTRRNGRRRNDFFPFAGCQGLGDANEGGGRQSRVNTAKARTPVDRNRVEVNTEGELLFFLRERGGVLACGASKRVLLLYYGWKSRKSSM